MRVGDQYLMPSGQRARCARILRETIVFEYAQGGTVTLSFEAAARIVKPLWEVGTYNPVKGGPRWEA